MKKTQAGLQAEIRSIVRAACEDVVQGEPLSMYTILELQYQALINPETAPELYRTKRALEDELLAVVWNK